MATKNYLRIHRAWGPVRKSMALTTTRLNDTLDDLVAKGTIAQDADYDDKRACLNCRSGESMFKWCAEADDIWGRDEKKRSLNTINESIAKSCAPFIRVVSRSHLNVLASGKSFAASSTTRSVPAPKYLIRLLLHCGQCGGLRFVLPQ